MTRKILYLTALLSVPPVLPAHGTRPMPVWGYELEAQVPPDQPAGPPPRA